jgi:hypothetical protein
VLVGGFLGGPDLAPKAFEGRGVLLGPFLQHLEGDVALLEGIPDAVDDPGGACTEDLLDLEASGQFLSGFE